MIHFSILSPQKMMKEGMEINFRNLFDHSPRHLRVRVWEEAHYRYTEGNIPTILQHKCIKPEGLEAWKVLSYSTERDAFVF